MNRKFRHANSSQSILSGNSAHNFALRYTMKIFGPNACCTFIPKNGCSTLRYSVARANGCVDDLADVNWIHNNNPTFNATTETAFQAAYTFAFLRCPFSRIYSAFIDKMVNMDIQSWRLYNDNGRETHPHDITFRAFVTWIAKTKPNRQDPHWRNQNHFFLFDQYDDLFCIEKFDDAIKTLKSKIDFEVVDTRLTINHDASKLNTEDAMQNPFDLPAVDLLVAKRGGHVPPAHAMFDDKITGLVRDIYRDDFELYEAHFGKSPLMQNFA